MTIEDIGGVPAVEQYDDGAARCPYGCEAETHVHGVAPEGLTHRASHCREKTGGDRGYYLMRPHVSLLGLPCKWWQETRNPFALDSGPGLLTEGRAA